MITDLGVFAIDKKGDGGMRLIEIADGVTEDEIRVEDRGGLHGGAHALSPALRAPRAAQAARTPSRNRTTSACSRAD